MPTSNHPPHWRARPASSRAFIYPLAGIKYLAQHRFLWPLLRSRLLPVTILSTVVFVLLLTFAYLPQALLLALFHGKAAFFNALILVLGESAALTQMLFEAFLVDETLVDAFDSTLVAQGHQDLVLTTRPVLPPSEGDPKQRLARPTVSSVFEPFSLRQIAEFVLLLPLTLIPWAGVPLFLWGTGYRAGPLLQHRYFDLKGFTKQERKEYVRARRGAYTGFGVMHVALQLIPVASMGLLLTTAIGSALWAASTEDERLNGEGRRGAGNRNGDGDGEGYGTMRRGQLDGAPPPYSEDDPV